MMPYMQSLIHYYIKIETFEFRHCAFTDISNSCLHFLVAANDNPITPAPAYKSATDAPRGTYLCSFRRRVSKAWDEVALDQMILSRTFLRNGRLKGKVAKFPKIKFQKTGHPKS